MRVRKECSCGCAVEVEYDPLYNREQSCFETEKFEADHRGCMAYKPDKVDPFKEYERAWCGLCEKEMTIVRPGKHQCDNPDCEDTE